MVESAQAAVSERSWRKVFRWFRRLSLRSRLIAAFLVLIVTSASATIVIGNLVFGQKVVELAVSKMEAGLQVVALGLSARLDRLALLAKVEAERYDRFGEVVVVKQGALAEERVLDFLLLRTPTGSSLTRFGRYEAPSGSPTQTRAQAQAQAEPGGKVSVVSGPFAVDGPWLESSELGLLARQALKTGTLQSGLLALPPAAMIQLRYAQPPSEGLFLVAAAPLANGGVLLLGALLNGRTELVAGPLDRLWPGHRMWHEATLFLRDTRVATTIGEGGIGSHVDHRVFTKVLEEGKPYLGSAKVLGATFYTAYTPLRDYRGRAIGILGIGAREAVYEDLRNRTITLFSGLIAAGMIFGFFMTYLFSAWLIRPVAELAKGMERVAGGDLSYKVRIGSADELGKLARAFNQMVKAIKERDIRLREMTEERLSQVEKQVSIGRLAAGVAHEINNPLTSILSLSILMGKTFAPDDPRREDVDIVVEETTRCRDIVRNLLDFARERPTEKKLVDINQVLRETLVLVSKYDGMERMRTKLQLAEERLLVLGDPKQLQQVFTNIVTNAAEAIETRGRITISTDEDSSGGFVVIRVKDTGKGIAREDLDRVFEPFFTTKDTGKGTGLGLSVSLGIIRKHEGTIELDSQVDEGTTVTIVLPRVAEEQVAALSLAVPVAQGSGGTP